MNEAMILTAIYAVAMLFSIGGWVYVLYLCCKHSERWRDNSDETINSKRNH